MFRLMLQKMWHKKWMNLCLLLGCILLVAVSVSFPLYQQAAYDRMLQDEFEKYIQTEGKWPATQTMTIVSKKDKSGGTIASMEKLLPELYSNLGVQEKETSCFYSLSQNGIHSTTNRVEAESISIRLSAMSRLEEHVDMLSGQLYPESGLTEDGVIGVVMSQDCMVSQGLLVGETIIFDALKGPNKEELKMYICGVFAPKNGDDYWQNKSDTKNVCLMEPSLFKQMFTGENAGGYTITCNYMVTFEYSNLKDDDVDRIVSKTDYYTEESGYKTVLSKPDYREILEEYLNKKNRIAATLSILQVPVFIMLAAFLLMISGQMYEMERSEISVIKSRGSSGAQIFRLYLYQGISLMLMGAIGGVPLGIVFSKLLGATRDFLIFDFNETLAIRFTSTAAVYGLLAMLVGLLCLTVPAIKHSRVTIVALKRSNATKKKALWEKMFLDLILIAIAMYGYYSFNRSSSSVSTSIMEGQSLDPLLYICSSLMIVGAGLLFLRLQPQVLKLVFLAGKKFWKPASFISFMENIKNGRKQQMIQLFLIMTISLGLYHSTVARTILDNAVENTAYLDGCDVVVKEVWSQLMDRNGGYTGEYIEPNFNKYSHLDIADGVTKVLFDEKAYVNGQGGGHQDVTLMGIHTREFGEMTMVSTSLMGGAYYDYLNELAPVENGVLLSSNFRDQMGFKVGDNITYYNFNKKSITAKIVDFVSYWPGYAPEVTVLNPDGTSSRESNFLVIAHYEYINSKMGTMPYEVWIDMKDGATASDLYQWIEAEDVRLTKYVNRDADLEATQTDPLLQGTNGVLTMGFVVTIILCAVGYLIYWILSIRGREMIFGVLRASGLHRKELLHMLLNEQIFAGLFSIVAGWGIGTMVAKMYVPILQHAYASANQVLPMKLIMEAADLYRLFAVIMAVVVICLGTLVGMLFKMNVTKALKLGEE